MNPSTSAQKTAPAARQVVRQLSALQLIQAPRAARWLAWVMVIIFVVSPFLLMWLPWQQNIQASGRVIAFDPTERQQTVEAPVDGRILNWHVKEGQNVRGPVYSDDGKLIRAGDLLVSIQDPDPDLPRRLTQQRRAILERTSAANERITSFTNQVTALKQSRQEALKAAQNRLSMGIERAKAAEQSVEVAMLKRGIERTNFSMEKELVDDGLTSRLNFLSAKQRYESAVAEEKRAGNSLLASRSEVEALRADVSKIANDADAAINSANASRQSAEAELASANRDLQDIDIRIARQMTQEVRAPCDGVIYRVHANSAGGGTIVKQGERLLTITPEIKNPGQRTVELYLDGNDAPQLTELWRKRLASNADVKFQVRLQFEGYPAIQIIGWPNMAVGTFAGKIVLVDPHDDGKGRFRILVEPDPDEDPWPEAISLRQGLRAQGWVLLDRVSMGYELWRRFNGFPPVVTGKDEDAGPKKKPGKVKVPK